MTSKIHHDQNKMAGFDVDDLPIEDELKGSPNSLTPYSTPIKANLNIGSFQDGNRRPWVLTSVKKVDFMTWITCFEISLANLCWRTNNMSMMTQHRMMTITVLTVTVNSLNMPDNCSSVIIFLPVESPPSKPSMVRMQLIWEHAWCSKLWNPRQFGCQISTGKIVRWSGSGRMAVSSVAHTLTTMSLRIASIFKAW